jgi:hypothetical protein
VGLELFGREHVGRRVHRLGPQPPDAGLGEDVVVAPEFLGALTPLARLDLPTALLDIGREHVTRRVHQTDAFSLRHHLEARGILGHQLEQFSRGKQPGLEIVGVAHGARDSSQGSA